MSDPTGDATPAADETQAAGEIPNPHTGVGIGAQDEPDTFEPEESPEL